jgi:hypothetical protein
MEAALEDDPDNYYFPLLSESCIPLYAFSKFYRILTTTGINKSIITACPHTEHGNMEEESRWSKTLENSKHLKWEHWRKSGQWIMLIQSHAKLFVSYTEDDEYWQKVPCSDEHFLPTLLATFGKDAETTCSDGFTNVYWDHPSWGSHPYSYLSEEINRNLFYNLRFAKLQPEEWSKPKIIGLNNQLLVTRESAISSRENFPLPRSSNCFLSCSFFWSMTKTIIISRLSRHLPLPIVTKTSCYSPLHPLILHLLNTLVSPFSTSYSPIFGKTLNE